MSSFCNKTCDYCGRRNHTSESCRFKEKHTSRRIILEKRNPDRPKVSSEIHVPIKTSRRSSREPTPKKDDKNLSQKHNDKRKHATKADNIITQDDLDKTSDNYLSCAQCVKWELRLHSKTKEAENSIKQLKEDITKLKTENKLLKSLYDLNKEGR